MQSEDHPGNVSAEGDPKRITLNRRRFVRLAGTAGVVAAAPAMSLMSGNAVAAPAPARSLPRQWDEVLDVVIVGSGFAGLAAAAEAAARGSNAVIIEKMPILGGNSRINGGAISAWTDTLQLRQKLGLGDDSADLHFKDTLAGGDYFNIPELARVMVDGAPDGLNWMLREGDLKLRNALVAQGGHSAYRFHLTTDGSGRGYIDALQKIGARNGVKKVRLNTKLTWIWRRDPSGPVLGIEVETPRGTRNIKVNQALVLTSGGFARNVQMRQAFCPYLTDAFNCTNQPGATGEVLRFAQAIGADALHLAFIQLVPHADPDSGLVDRYSALAGRMPSFGGIYVTPQGKRFVGELGQRNAMARTAINTGFKRAFCVFSDNMVVKTASQTEVSQGVAAERVWKADTLSDLARQIGVPATTLEETLAKHNDYFKNRKDADFNKPFLAAMMSMEEGPYYSVALWPSVHHCQGGVRINTSAQVIDLWGKPIPHLYAAGEVAGGVQGNNRLGGNGVANCIVYGRIAGTNAAKEKKL